MVTGPVSSGVFAIVIVFLSSVVHETGKRGVAELFGDSTTTTTLPSPLLEIEDRAPSPSTAASGFPPSGPPPIPSGCPVPVCEPCDCPVASGNNTSGYLSSDSERFSLLLLASVAGTVGAFIGGRASKRPVIVVRAAKPVVKPAVTRSRF